MRNKSSENYLDNLLDSITGTGSSSAKSQEEASFEDPASSFSESDDDFLRAFEAELEADSYKHYFNDFEMELEAEQQHSLELRSDEASISDDFGAILRSIGEEEVETVPQMPEPTAEAVLPDERVPSGDSMESLLDGLDVDTLSLDEPDLSAEESLPMTDAGEPDLSGSGEDDLLELLAKSGELEDIGEILSGDTPIEVVGEEDTFSSFADAQMQKLDEEAESAEDAPEEEGGKKQRSRKKRKTKDKDGAEGSFIERMKKLLFGEDDEENPPSGADGDLLEKLTDENAAILSELDKEESAAKGKKDKKADKKKKEKKPAKKKEPKPKKPAKEKKPPKEKKLKEKDNGPKLPKGPVIMIVIMVASLTALVILGTNLLSYSSNVSQAKATYKAGFDAEGNYRPGCLAKAYDLLAGQMLREGDMELFQKSAVLAAVSSEYDAFLTFHGMGRETMAIDSLVCAAGRHNLNLETARELGCEAEMEGIRAVVVAALDTEYHMTYEEALEIYNQRNRTEYSVLLYRKIKELGLE